MFDHMLIDVVEHHHVERVVRKRRCISGGEDEPYVMAEGALRRGEAGLVDIDADRGRTVTYNEAPTQ